MTAPVKRSIQKVTISLDVAQHLPDMAVFVEEAMVCYKQQEMTLGGEERGGRGGQGKEGEGKGEEIEVTAGETKRQEG